MRDLGMLVYHQIFDMDILTDGTVCKNDTVLDNSALLMVQPRPTMEFSTVPSIMEPLEITELETLAVSK